MHVQGVELRDMGQLMERGRHPIHFHMCYDVDDVPNPAYVKSVSIRNSYSMCIVATGTSGLTVRVKCCWLVGCVTSQQYAGVFQGRIFSDDCMCCHAGIEVVDQTSVSPRHSILTPGQPVLALTV